MNPYRGTRFDPTRANHNKTPFMSNVRGLICRGGCEARFLTDDDGMDALLLTIAVRNEHELDAHSYTHRRTN